jgi:hypothetical protein
MELENILKDFLEEKEITKKESVNETTFLSISNLEKKSKDYDKDQDMEDEDYDDMDEEEDDEDYNDEDEEYVDLDIETISDIERIKIACDILNHIENDYLGLDKIIMTLQDIIEENEY